MRLADSVESWSVGASQWRGIARLQPRCHGQLFLAADAALVSVGGQDLDAGTIARVERLDLRRAEWSPLTALAVDRYCATAIAFGTERWVVAGGLSARDEGLTASNVVEIVDAVVGVAERLPALPFACAEPLLAVLEDGLLVAGGYEDNIGRDVAVYSVRGGAWAMRDPLPRPRTASIGPFELDDRYSLWVGGWCECWEGAVPEPALLLDRDSVVVTEVSFFVPHGACVVELAKGTLLVAGGRADDGELLATTEIVRLGVQG